MNTGLKLLIMSAALSLACLGASAQAQVTCNLSGLANSMRVDFGTHTPNAVNDAVSPSGLRLSCSNNAAVDRNIKVCVELGSGWAGMLGDMRALRSGPGVSIRYQIYRDAARSQVFGLVPYHAEFTGTVAADTSSIVDTQIRLYGRIPAGETAIHRSGAHQSWFDENDLFIRYSDYALGESAPDCAARSGNQISYGVGVVQVRVRVLCSVSVTSNVVFPDQTSLTSAVDASGNLRVDCQGGLPYQIALNDGLHAQGTQRRMRYGNHLIDYELYRDPARQNRWGSVAAEMQPRTGNATVQNYWIYARVPAAQTIPGPGDYQDTVLVTVHY